MSKELKEIKIHVPVVSLLMSNGSKEIKIHAPVVCLFMSKGSKVPVQNVIVLK